MRKCFVWWVDRGLASPASFRLLAIRDEWFSDDLKKLDDDRVFLKLQGHWIIEMSEMLATSSAKSIEEIRSFISRQKETYRTPYEAQPKDRLRQCVFGGSSNTLDFLPLDRAGNRRFLPIMIYPENAEVHILEDEDASRAYLLQVWAEAMTVLPQRPLLHEIQQVHPAAACGGAEGFHAGGHGGRTDTGLSGTLHRQHGLLQTAF